MKLVIQDYLVPRGARSNEKQAAVTEFQNTLAVTEFQNTLARLMSLLHACAFDSVSTVEGFKCEVLDIHAMDESRWKHFLQSG